MSFPRTPVLALALLLIVMTLALTPAAAATEIQVEVLSAWWTPAYRNTGDWLDSLKEDFEAKYPGMTINYIESKGIDGLILHAASGTRSPDVVLTRVAWAQNAYKRGLVAPLTKYMEGSFLKDMEFFPAALHLGQSGGEIYALPRALEAYTIVYNLELFEEAGIDPDPDAIQSWNELVEIGRRLHRVSGTGEVRVAGFNTGLNAPLFASWLYANGGQFYNDDFTAVAFDSPEGRETMAFLADLITQQKLGGLGGISEFHAGNVAMMTHQLPGGPVLNEAPFKTAQSDFPKGPSGQRRSTATWSNLYSISAYAEHPDLAWAWIEMALSLEQQENYAIISGYPIAPPYMEAYTSSVLTELYQEFPSSANTPHILQTAGVWPFVGYENAVAQGVVTPIFTGIANGTMNPISGVAEIARLWNLAIDD